MKPNRKIMSRSLRTFKEAMREALLAVMFSAIGVAGCVWAVRAGMSTLPFGSALFVLSLTVLIPAMGRGRECLRLLRKSEREAAHEQERTIRHAPAIRLYP